MALQALQNTRPEQAMPMLEKLLEGTASPRLKERALFVLAQSNSPRAREVLNELAQRQLDAGAPEPGHPVPRRARRRESRAALAEVYASTTDVDVKRRILRAFMVAGEKDRAVHGGAQTSRTPSCARRRSVSSA